MSEPKFAEYPLADFHLNRIMYAVNRDFLWPLGLALTIETKHEGEEYVRLFVSEWEYDDGHREAIEDDQPEYAKVFGEWLAQRRLLMPDADRAILETRHGS